MRYIRHGTKTNNLSVAILTKNNALNKVKIERFYINPIKNTKAQQFISLSLWYNDKNKAPAGLAREYLTELLPEIDELGITTIMVCDTPYFKYLTGKSKAEPYYGYVLPCTIEGFEHMNVLICPNYQAMMYKPELQVKIDRTLETLDKWLLGIYTKPGINIINTAYYPDSSADIQRTLASLKGRKELTADIEGKSLEFWACGISSIAFAWDKHNGVAFGVDRCLAGDDVFAYRTYEDSREIRNMLMDFFINFEGKLIWHNIAFDGKVLAYTLFMKHLADYKGMIEGIKCFTRCYDDTKLIAYMATNNAVQNELGLKTLSCEFTGNYAQEDIKDTDKISLPALLEYNLKDCLATWFVKDKYYPTMVDDEQEDLYEGLMKDSVCTLMQTELCGMPINPAKVQLAKRKLTKIYDKCQDFFKNCEFVQDFHMKRLVVKAEKKTLEAAAKAKTDRGTKVYTWEDSVIFEEFNPNSGTQLSGLLYDYLGYPVLDFTKAKAPATGKKTLEKLKAHTEKNIKRYGVGVDYDPDKLMEMEEHLEMFEQLVHLSGASIILSTFIPAFENAQQLPDGSWRLYGNFNAAGTQSLRLSSSQPNLMNLPSGSVFAKLVKDCFETITGWLFVGSDYDALEDKTGALLTKDPERLKIYTEGFCGHCVRAQYYWPDKMPDIDPSDKNSVNNIKKKYKVFRQDSKAPSFALQYMGTFKTLMNNCGFTEAEAKSIEANYHKLYVVSDEWTAAGIEQAKIDGYVTMAFGARLRTPLLAKTVGTGRGVPYAAMAEGRSAGNARTQSYCVLTLRAFNEFRKRLWDSPYIYDILPSATIHDAIYLMIRSNGKALKWANDNLIDCMRWQDLPELKHETITMSSALEVFWPSWKHIVEIPNDIDEDEIKTICQEAGEKFREENQI